ncbi:MAG: right-handed parallel beta-helix repeat-containing protein [Planctomycetota bacterium]|nr:right-handed parallel beta-helix repeat-containing protein [Planctomycetota bacterium]
MNLRSPLRFLLLLIWPLVFCSSVFGVDIRVPLDVPGIQQAIDIASDGDVIIVAAGVWNESINYSGKNIEIRSEDGPEVTRIEGNLDSSVVTINSGESNLALLEGFAISGGGGFVTMGPRLGGGIYISSSSPQIRQCVVENNQASMGGGIYIDGDPADPVELQEVQILSNIASDSGGGVAVIEAGMGVSMVDCTIQGNQADTVAGAVYCEASVLQMQSSVISQNSSEMLVGGIWIYLGSDSNFNDCQMSQNSATIVGGALAVSDYSRTTVDHCTFTGNSGGSSGGGILFDVGEDQIVQEVRFSVFHDNMAAGTGSNVVSSFNPIQLVMERCTFGSPAPGSASSIRINSPYPESVLLDSCIVRGGALPSIEAVPGSTVSYFSCIEGLDASEVTPFNCIDEDPLFADPTSGNLTLLPGSPCIDSGNPAQPADPDGSLADMGALGITQSDNFRRGDVNVDGVSNIADAIQILGSLFIQGSDPLGCIDAGDCNDDGLLNISDAITLLDTLFVSGTPLPVPVGNCGPDPTVDSLGCSNLCS